jgi:hypothetical protein
MPTRSAISMDPIWLIVFFQIATADRPFEVKTFRDMSTREAYARQRHKDPDVAGAKCQTRLRSSPPLIVDPPPKGIMVR